MKVMKLHKVLPHKLLTALCIVFFLCVPGLVAAEEIESFESVIEIQKDGSFVVTETILYDFQTEQRHGIVRDIAHRHPQDATAWHTFRTIELSVESVLRDGVPEPFALDKDKYATYVKIGHPDKTIAGEHTYEIRYVVQGGLSYLDTGVAEIYWNTTGNNWPVVIKKATTVVHAQDAVLLDEYDCYQGDVQSTVRCEALKDASGQTVFTAENLAPGAGLTIAQTVNPELVKVQIIEKFRWGFFVGLGTFTLLLGFLIWFIRVVYKNTTLHKPAKRPVVAQYEPYLDVLPMQTGVLIDGRLDGRDITAGFLHLAQNGFIKIKKTNKKVLFFIELDDYEVTLLRNPSETASAFGTHILSLLFPVGAVGTHVKLSYIKQSTSRQKANYKKLQSLKKDIKADLGEHGFYESTLFFWRKTKKGYDAIWHLKGFKEFLKVADTERFKFHNAPAKSPEQFMEFLPYAVAFGVEKQWAEVFKDIVIENPDWYDGGDVHAFSVASAAHSLSALSTAINAASGSGYSSSSSASGGGGFSGGGGGGGGGGSW